MSENKPFARDIHNKKRIVYETKRMYARINLTGDGTVDIPKGSCWSSSPSSTTPSTTTVKIPNPPIAGNLGLYSGSQPLPDTCGHLYQVGADYDTFANLPVTTEYLNRLGLTAMPDYARMPTPLGTDGYFYPMDGRIIDTARGMPIILDRPAAVGHVDMSLVNTFDNSNYGAVYGSYSDIRNGQIGYYVDAADAQPFSYPVYSIPSTVEKVIRKDPMDAIKPEYIKTPAMSTLHALSNDQQTRDALSFREDLMSLQQSRVNRERWQNRWVEPSQKLFYPTTSSSANEKNDKRCTFPYAKS